ncbi:MAG: GspH/FimT family pseudopilin [Steroidobacteraceae bacterium]
MESIAKFPRGFTLIELMIAVLIFAILAAIGIPSWRDTMQNNRVTGATNNIVTALNVARSEAVRRGVPVTLCGVANPDLDPANLVCAGDTDWTTGWMVFRDNAAPAGQRTAGDTNDVVLQVWPAVGGNVIAKANVNFASYDVAGMMTVAGDKIFRVGATGTACTKVGETRVTVVGNIRTAKATCPT